MDFTQKVIGNTKVWKEEMAQIAMTRWEKTGTFSWEMRLWGAQLVLIQVQTLGAGAGKTLRNHLAGSTLLR